MQPPALPRNEHDRLDALRGLRLLDTPPDPRFDRYVRIARELLEMPIACVTLVDAARQWFKSCEGLPTVQTDRDISFCGHAILEPGLLYVRDAADDARFAGNPLVTGGPGIRAYVGAPLHLAGGLAVGTLCAIDTAPRTLDSEQLMTFRDLADCVQRELALHQLMGEIRQFHSGARLVASPAFGFLTTRRMPLAV